MPKTSPFYITLAGLTTFVVLYFLATLYYPGGNQEDAKAVGFSWMHNYWCNLLNQYAINGKPNTGRWWAIAAAIVLSASLIHFWYLFSRTLVQQKNGATADAGLYMRLYDHCTIYVYRFP